MIILIKIKISNIYRTTPRAICPIISEFLIILRLNSQEFTRVKEKQNTRNEENTGHNAIS